MDVTHSVVVVVAVWPVRVDTSRLLRRLNNLYCDCCCSLYFHVCIFVSCDSEMEEGPTSPCLELPIYSFYDKVKDVACIFAVVSVNVCTGLESQLVLEADDQSYIPVFAR